MEEAKLVVGFQLPHGKTCSAKSAAAFMTELLSQLPSFIHLRVVHADSILCVPEWLDTLEERHLRYGVVARMPRPFQRVPRQYLIWLFQTKLGWQRGMTAAMFPFGLFTTGGKIRNKARRKTIRLGCRRNSGKCGSQSLT